MAGLRVIAAVALAGCAAADAQPTAASGIKPPAGWVTLAAAATAARMATGARGVTVDGAEAWGEPAKGCYALWIAFHGGNATAAELSREILDGLAAEHITVTQETAPEGMLALGLERSPYQGGLRARLFDGRVTALACVANRREPATCVAACKTLLGALP